LPSRDEFISPPEARAAYASQTVAYKSDSPSGKQGGTMFNLTDGQYYLLIGMLIVFASAIGIAEIKRHG
jgi:hypothetical protein